MKILNLARRNKSFKTVNILRDMGSTAPDSAKEGVLDMKAVNNIHQEEKFAC